MLRKEKRADGMVWTFCWSEVVNGRRHQPKAVIGTTKQFPTEAEANREADRLRCRLNENKQSLSLKPIAFWELINHYLDHELPRLSRSAQKANRSYIINWIEPSWHAHLACNMKTMQIQEWLDKIERPDGTKLKIKNVLSTIFSHGVRWELVDRNPVCGQGGSLAAAVLQPAFGRAAESQSYVWFFHPTLFVELWRNYLFARRRWRWSMRSRLSEHRS
jgi:integrase